VRTTAGLNNAPLEKNGAQREPYRAKPQEKAAIALEQAHRRLLFQAAVFFGSINIDQNAWRIYRNFNNPTGILADHHIGSPR
jgi:hypothetical protein